jgi:hypothetical protein
MPIIFKPVGTSGPRKLEIRNDTIGPITLTDIEAIFNAYGINEEEMENIKFVANSETIKSKEKVYEITKEENLTIFVFSAARQLKEKLDDIFIKHSTFESQDLPVATIVPATKNIDSFLQRVIDTPVIEEVTPTLDDETVKSINEKTSKLFDNDDFKELVRIYYTNQGIMKTFLNFIVHGDIVKINIPESVDTKTYSNEVAILKQLGITESDENIIKCLSNFNGHLNLTLRALLVRKAVISDI